LVGNGKGGRNQELALRFALHSSELEGPWVLLSGGTDGRDGPTDAAGGIVDDETISRLGAEKAQAHLDNNDAYHALQASDDLLMTGGTGTNVADLQLLLLPQVIADI
ncbi:MAG: MOFRL family protein, partial [Pseudomonadota bacterium]